MRRYWRRLWGAEGDDIAADQGTDHIAADQVNKPDAEQCDHDGDHDVRAYGSFWGFNVGFWG